MHYTMFVWPHANARYQMETEKLARAELALTLRRAGVEFCWEEREEICASLSFETKAPLDARALELVGRHSLLYGLFARGEEGSLSPLIGRRKPCVGGDLAGILKYKGKTNEIFTAFLLNMAWLSGAMPERARLLDPMCGRATALFVGANLGWDVCGSDIDRGDLREAEGFFKRYLQYHRFKYALTHSSLTLPGKKSAPCAQFTFQQRTLRLAEMDASRVREAFGREKFDLVCADLPYGVQHAPTMPLEKLLEKCLPAWREVLCRGGAMAVSFNVHTLRAQRVREAMRACGLRVMEGEAYDALAHWVEQAVTRDVAVAVRD